MFLEYQENITFMKKKKEQEGEKYHIRDHENYLWGSFTNILNNLARGD